MGEHADHLTGAIGPLQQACVHEYPLPARHEGVQACVLDQMNADERGVQPCDVEQWRGVNPDGIFDLGIADQEYSLGRADPRAGAAKA